MEDFNNLSRKELQALAKSIGLKANLKTSELIAGLQQSSITLAKESTVQSQSVPSKIISSTPMVADEESTELSEPTTILSTNAGPIIRLANPRKSREITKPISPTIEDNTTNRTMDLKAPSVIPSISPTSDVNNKGIDSVLDVKEQDKVEILISSSSSSPPSSAAVSIQKLDHGPDNKVPTINGIEKNNEQFTKLKEVENVNVSNRGFSAEARVMRAKCLSNRNIYSRSTSSSSINKGTTPTHDIQGRPLSAKTDNKLATGKTIASQPCSFVISKSSKPPTLPDEFKLSSNSKNDENSVLPQKTSKKPMRSVKHTKGSIMRQERILAHKSYQKSQRQASVSSRRSR